MKHSNIGGSGAPRWMNCAGSVALSADLVSLSSEYAAEGTLAHTMAQQVLEEWLKTGLYLIYQHVGEKHTVEGFDFTVSTEMMDAVAFYVHYVVKTVIGLKFKTTSIEDTFHCPSIHPDFYGTADCVLWDATGTLYVIDYKHGAGVYVGAESNWQLVYYAVGVIAKMNLKPKHLKLVIVQPRAEDANGEIIREWELTFDEFKPLAKELIAGIKATDDPNAKLNPGTWCRFCPASQNWVCPEIIKQSDELLAMDFSDDEDYTSDRMARALDIAELLKPCISRIHQAAYTHAQHGRLPKGWKLVDKMPRFAWNESLDESYLELLGLEVDEYHAPSKLRSPTQVAALLGKNGKALLAPVATPKSSGTTLVRESDKRLAVDSPLTTDFDKV